MKKQLQLVKIKNIKRIDKRDRYDITVPKTSNFFANGILVHNCNAILANLLTKRKLSFIDKIAKFFGAKIQDTHYYELYSSRRVIKNAYADKHHASFYDTDVWALMNDKYKHCIQHGISLIGEVVGQIPNGKWIQSNYDYGITPNTCDFFVFRITYTTPDGEVYEFDTQRMIDYCAKYNLKIAPIFFRGKAKDVFPELDVQNHWHENFLQKLIDKYTEKQCYMCVNPVPEEGIVLSKRYPEFEAYKLKSFAFFERETKELDGGIVNVEDSE